MLVPHAVFLSAGFHALASIPEKNQVYKRNETVCATGSIFFKVDPHSQVRKRFS